MVSLSLDPWVVTILTRDTAILATTSTIMLKYGHYRDGTKKPVLLRKVHTDLLLFLGYQFIVIKRQVPPYISALLFLVAWI